MSAKENRSIAYIYNEMDPSEKLEFERDLQNDSDLLIEVESLKKVSKNLNQLGHINPPSHIVQAVYDSAKNNSNQSRAGHWRTFFYSVAALLLIGMTSGIFMMDSQESDENDNRAESAAFSATPIISQPVHSSSAGTTAPWVDNNEILYFQRATGSGNQAEIDSLRNDSFKKLTPVTDPTLIRTYQRQLQLTGSRN
ncbi:MAG: hypothetical protein R3220_10735 [Balneolaceae bacterium]|nr:hypothetical protein [Balneolaceae bacterium]